MIQKIQSNEYLKRIDNMSLAEKGEYAERVGEWMRKHAPLLAPEANSPMAAYQNVMQLCVSWNDGECEAWMEGVRLMTAMVSIQDTWLPEMIYIKAARRTIKKMMDCLGRVLAVNVAKPEQEVTLEKPAKAEKAAAAQKPNAIKQADANLGKPTVTMNVKPLRNSEVAPAPIRPKHIDQYIHLLPKKTQEKAAMVRGLLRDLDVARENARKLMDAGEHSDKIAQWAKTATKLDDKVRSIYREIDAEWENLVKSGVVSVDAFGNAVVSESVQKAEPQEDKPKKQGRPAMTEEEKAAKAAEKAEKKKQDNQRKAALLRKWLIDTRNAKTESQRNKWLQKYNEMVKLGGEETVTDKVREAAAFYGIDLSAKDEEEKKR